MREAIIGTAKWIMDYLEIPNYLMVRAKGTFQGEKTYTSEEEYWRDVLGPVFYKRPLRNPVKREGDVLILKNFQLSPWSPRLPGLYWTKLGDEIRYRTEEELTYIEGLGFHYDPNRKKSRMILGGLGTVRLDKHERYSLYGATTSGKLDAAIPVLMSSNVSKNILRFSKRCPLMEVDLKGVLKIVPLTYRSDVRSAHIPKLCFYVNSILNVKKYISDFSLQASAWTIYHNPRSRRTDKKFGYTYCRFNPLDESTIVEATDWLNNYIDTYTRGKGLPLTDYDELVPRFQSATLPLKDIMEGFIDYDTLNSLFGGIDLRTQAPFGHRHIYY